MNGKNVVIRSISGCVYIALILLGIYFGVVGVTVLGIILGSLATIEFEKICHDVTPRTLPGLILDIIGVTLITLIPSFPELGACLWLVVLICRLVAELYLHSGHPLNNLAHSLMTQLYIGLPMGGMVLLTYLAGWSYILLAIFLLIWINDTGAFLVGSLIGKHRLFERISPKKSWEGFLGGLVLDIIAAICFCIYIPRAFPLPSSLWVYIVLAIVVSLFSTWGDLIESMIKRELKIKDSGNIIPGHGGILDRIDSLLLVIPASLVYYFLLMLLL